MANSDTLTRLSPYAERLLDDYIYDQLDDAGGRLQAAYARLARRPARKALEDKRLRNQVVGAAASIRRAALAAAGREPEPKRSRLPRLLFLLGVAGGVTVLLQRRRESASGLDYANSTPETGHAEPGAVEYA